MQNGMLTKGLILGIIVLFFGTSVLPSNTAGIGNKKEITHKNEYKSIFPIGASDLPIISRSLNTYMVKGNTFFDKENSLSPLDGPSWIWAKSAGGTTHQDYGFGVAVDSSGNAYITGLFQRTATFGNNTLTSHGTFGVFVAKLNTNSDWHWAKGAGETDPDDEGYGVAVDSNGNAYITGGFAGTATFGNITLTSQGDIDVFVAKLSRGNKPPSPPIIAGPIQGKVGVKCEYNFSLSDPNGDSMYLRVDWGNGTSGPWQGPFDSDTTVRLNHSWNQEGNFTIGAQAKDIYGAEGDWGTLSVTMPLNLQISQSFSQQINQQSSNQLLLKTLQRVLLNIK
jgi:hypothetical protein